MKAQLNDDQWYHQRPYAKQKQGASNHEPTLPPCSFAKNLTPIVLPSFSFIISQDLERVPLVVTVIQYPLCHMRQWNRQNSTRQLISKIRKQLTWNNYWKRLQWSAECSNEILELTDLLPMVQRWLAAIVAQSPARHLFPFFFCSISIQLINVHDYRNVNGIPLLQLSLFFFSFAAPSHCQTIAFIYIFYLIYVFSDRLSVSRSSNLRLINSSIASDMNCKAP